MPTFDNLRLNSFDISNIPTHSLYSPTPKNTGLFAFEVSSFGDQVAIGEPQSSGEVVSGGGSVHLFDAGTGTLGTSVHSPAAAGGFFGGSIAPVGDKLLVGAGGAARAFLINPDTGLPDKTYTSPNPNIDRFFGNQVATLGNDLIIADSHENGNGPGSVYRIDKSSGQPLARYQVPGASENDLVGRGLTTVGSDTVVVGAPNSTGGTGSVYVYNADGSPRNFGGSGNALISGGSLIGDFNTLAALDSDHVIVGDKLNSTYGSNAGAAYIYNVHTGEQVGEPFRAPTPRNDARFGSAVAVSGDNILIGASRDTAGGVAKAGAAYLFNRSGELLRVYENPDPHAEDTFGQTLAFVGNQVVIGAAYDDTKGQDAGAAYLFDAVVEPEPPVQKVYLDWDRPISMRTEVRAKHPILCSHFDTIPAFCKEELIFDPNSTHNTVVTDDSYRLQVANQLRFILEASEVSDFVEIVDAPSNDSVVVRFGPAIQYDHDGNPATSDIGFFGSAFDVAEPFKRGRRVSETIIDRFNRRADGEVAIFLDPATYSVEFVAEVIAHEVGHAFGLRHIDPNQPDVPTDALPVMDRHAEPNDVERFTDGRFGIVDSLDRLVTHNPIYHLRRYIEGTSRSELESLGILPGGWDIPDTESQLNAFEFDLSFFYSDVTLYDVSVQALLGEDEWLPVLYLEQLDSQTADSLSFIVEEGLEVRIIASTVPGGQIDAFLGMSSSDGPSMSLAFSSGGLFSGEVIIASDALNDLRVAGGFNARLSVIVPEPSCFFSATVALLLALTIRLKSQANLFRTQHMEALRP